MESVTVLQTNPLTFIAEIVEAIEQGYLVESSNRGWVSDGVLKEINLYKNPDKVFEKKEIGEFVIDEWDTQKFLSELCDYIVCGGKVDIDSLLWPPVSKKYIEGKMFLIPEYTKEQLAEMTWSDFKEAVKSVAGTHRDRTLLTTRYLQMTGQLQ
jgi:hypothetical protein